MSRNGCNRYEGSVASVREVEDCIRATKKYKEYLGKRVQHPVQGGDFPSECFKKHYEVYPEMEVGVDMSIIDAIFWLGKGTPCINIVFWYDYRANKASVTIPEGKEAISKLVKGIPNFKEALSGVKDEKVTV